MNEVRNVIVGFEMGEQSSQICYYDRNENQPVSLNMAGQSNATFPTYLSKKPSSEEYHYGVEAEYFAMHENEVLIDNLYEICLLKSSVAVDNQEMAPALLLKHFLGGVLSMLGIADMTKNIKAVMITVPKINKALVENVKAAAALLGFASNQMFLQDYNESFYYHTMSQKPEFSSRKVALFSVSKELLSFKELNVDRQTKPAMVTVKRGDQRNISPNPEARDEEFYDFANQAFGEAAYSSVFIIGTGFDKSWAIRSIPLLCRHQRPVFYGNNLYCKGACYAAKDKVEDKALKGYLFAGPDLVKINIGMDMMISGISSYSPLIEAGVNWYEAVAECEILLDAVDELVFTATRMEKGEKIRCVMALPNLPKRPPKATRLAIKMAFESARQCNIIVEDLGLGELYPSSGLTWHETMMC
jgi:hypothetical protein